MPTIRAPNQATNQPTDARTNVPKPEDKVALLQRKLAALKAKNKKEKQEKAAKNKKTAPSATDKMDTFSSNKASPSHGFRLPPPKNERTQTQESRTRTSRPTKAAGSSSTGQPTSTQPATHEGRVAKAMNLQREDEKGYVYNAKTLCAGTNYSIEAVANNDAKAIREFGESVALAAERSINKCRQNPALWRGHIERVLNRCEDAIQSARDRSADKLRDVPDGEVLRNILDRSKTSDEYKKARKELTASMKADVKNEVLNEAFLYQPLSLASLVDATVKLSEMESRSNQVAFNSLQAEAAGGVGSLLPQEASTAEEIRDFRKAVKQLRRDKGLATAAVHGSQAFAQQIVNRNPNVGAPSLSRHIGHSDGPSGQLIAGTRARDYDAPTIKNHENIAPLDVYLPTGLSGNATKKEKEAAVQKLLGDRFMLTLLLDHSCDDSAATNVKNPRRQADDTGRGHADSNFHSKGTHIASGVALGDVPNDKPEKRGTVAVLVNTVYTNLTADLIHQGPLQGGSLPEGQENVRSQGAE